METPFDIVEHDGKHYAVLSVENANIGTILHIIDSDDIDRVSEYSWHKNNDYIRNTSFRDSNGLRQNMYMHNFISQRMVFPGKGASESIDHINRCGRDNRKENLRLVSQAEQNKNQNRKGRTVELPPNSGVTVDDLPTNIYYLPPQGGHDEGFSVQIGGVPNLANGNGYEWKSIRTKGYSLRTKLQHAIYHLKELYKKHPELQELRALEQKRVELTTSFNIILQKSRFPADVIQRNLLPEVSSASFWDEETDEEIIRIAETHAAGKKKVRREDDVYAKYKLPTYCQPRKDRNAFRIDGHPDLPKYLESKGKKASASLTINGKGMTLDQKYEEMMKIYNELESISK